MAQEQTLLSAEEASSARRELFRRKLMAFAFVSPLLAFLFFAFVAPISTMLYRSAYHPTVAALIPQTLSAMKSWDGKSVPDKDVTRVFAAELKQLAKKRLSGQLAEELNRVQPGLSSVVKSTARKMRRAEDADLKEKGSELLVTANEVWGEKSTWQTVARAGQVYTSANYLTALDLETDENGSIRRRQSAQIYVALYTKTLRIALIITVLCVLLGYPLAYYLASAPSKLANALMVMVLLPFWTSLLVRTTSWIALLQTNGVVNSTLQWSGLIDTPLELLYTQFATIIAMTHILLPFMILPLYSVMKGIDPSYLRAALSMGSKPVPAFIRIYLPMSLPGLSAGALLVFIISVGYYITPALVGGTDGQMISNIIAFHMQQSNNWELAAALGSLLLILIVALYWTYDRLVGAGNIKLG